MSEHYSRDPNDSQDSDPQTAEALQDPFEYRLIKGHERTDRTWVTDQQVQMEYIQNTDNLIYMMTDGVPVRDRHSGETRIEVPDVAIFLDKSARPVAWLLKDLWPKMAPAPGSSEIPPIPQINFLNIDKEQWVQAVDPNGNGITDVSLISPSIIRSLRSIFVPLSYKQEGLTEAIDSAPTRLDDKTVLIIDELKASGRTLDIAQGMLERAFPDTRFAATHWMRDVTAVNEATGNNDKPVWYKKSIVTGRGVGNRNPDLSRLSQSQTQRLGAFFLSTRLPEPDPDSVLLRTELRHIALSPDVPYLPSFNRPDRKERMAALNGKPYEEVLAEMQAIKAQTRPRYGGRLR